MATATDTREVRARKIADAARRKALKIRGDTQVNRSTRARQALQVKADALDQVADVLKGKD